MPLESAVGVDPEMPSSSPDSKRRSTKARKPQSKIKMVYMIPAALGICWLSYILWSNSNPSALEMLGSDGEEGSSFRSMIKVEDLPAKYLPETGKHRNAGRLVIVGDVHGMKDSLVELLEKIRFDEKHDYLILAGDMVSKGPDSAGVVDLAIKVGATAVRGNHEDRVIQEYTSMVRLGEDENSDEIEASTLNNGNYKDRLLVKQLGRKRIKWLENCPLILRVGKLGKLGEVVVVHAGLAPGVKLQKQDPLMVMNMRTIGDNDMPSDEHKGHPWTKVCSSPPKEESCDDIFSGLEQIPEIITKG